MWEHLARFAGFRVFHEESGIVVANPQMRADIYLPQVRMILDQRTAVTCDKSLCAKAATTPGAAAEAGTVTKEDKWKAPVEAQGDIFRAPVVEEGGTWNQPALELVDLLSHRAGKTGIEQAIFKTYALQRLHTVSQIGVARLCRAVQPIPLGPRHIPTSVFRMGVPTRRPVGSALPSNSTAPRPQWQAGALQRFKTGATAVTHPLPFPRSPLPFQIRAPQAISPRPPAIPAMALAPVGPLHDVAA